MDRREMLQLAAVTAAGAIYPKLGEVADNEVSEPLLEHLYQHQFDRIIRLPIENATVRVVGVAKADSPPLLVESAEIVIKYDMVVTIDKRNNTIVDRRQASPKRIAATLKNVCGPTSAMPFYLGGSRSLPGFSQAIVISSLGLDGREELIELRSASYIAFGERMSDGGMTIINYAWLKCGEVQCSNYYTAQQLVGV